MRQTRKRDLFVLALPLAALGRWMLLETGDSSACFGEFRSVLLKANFVHEANKDTGRKWDRMAVEEILSDHLTCATPSC